MEGSGGVRGGCVEEDDGAVGEAGAFAEGGWCWGGSEGQWRRGWEGEGNAQYAEVRVRRKRRNVRYGRRSEGRVMVRTAGVG